MEQRSANSCRMTINERKFIEKALVSELRVDGCRPFDYRQLTIKFGRGFIRGATWPNSCHGLCDSQLVKPYRDWPNEGTRSIFTEFSPIADPSFEPRRPGEYAVELGCIVGRGLRESRAVDTESLCVLAGRLVWAIRVDIHILDNGGNLVDAANIAALAALMTFRRPECPPEGDNGQEVTVHPPKVKEPLPLIIHHHPVAVTFAFFGSSDILVIDPTHFEEAVMRGRMTATINASGDVCAVQKAGGEGVMQSVIMQCMCVASLKAADITSKIKNAVRLAFDCRLTADIARMHVAAAFMNAFVNAGFGQDKLMTSESESTRSWLFRTKKHRKTSVAASLGLILLWDVDAGLAQIDKYFDSNDNHIFAGALLAVGIITGGIKDDSDPALDLLTNYINEEDASIRTGAIMSLGLAYAGSQNGRSLVPILEDLTAPLDVLAFTAVSLGLVFVGSGSQKVANSIISSITMDRSEAELSNPLIRFLPLGVGLVFLGKKDSCEGTAKITDGLHKKLRKCFDLTLRSLAYAGTRDVEKVQNLLAYCEELTKEGSDEEGDTHQGTAVIGIALVAMAEEVGLDMAIQSLKCLLKYEGQNIRRAVPLSLALLCISNPKVNVMDTLSGLSHDTDSEVAMCAIISLGLIGAGTNNAQIASMLQGLAKHYSKEGSLLFCVRIAQGLLHHGKGLLTLSPYHSNHLLLSPTHLAGIITMLCACLDMKSIIMGDYPYVLYFLVLAMQPRMLMTLDENLEPLAVAVRVGEPVRTCTTPVVLEAEHAELLTEKYIPLSPVLEGFVILKENPHYLEEH